MLILLMSNLTGVNLSSANLVGVDLSGDGFEWSNIYVGANLIGVNLTDTISCRR